MRAVSLLPSATEIVSIIGADALLVGRSHECDFPDRIAGLPALTSQRTHYDPAHGIGAQEIDRAVRQQLDAHDSLYRLDVDRLLELAPDLIITQDLCDVCSIDLETVRGAARTIAERTGAEPEIVSLDPHTIEAVIDDVHRVGRAMGLPEKARDAAVTLRDRFFRTEEHVNAFAAKPIVGFLEWTDPLFIAGHWNVELIERAGGRHPLNETVAKSGHGAAEGPMRGERVAGKSVAVTPEVFNASQPDAIVIAPCGLTLDQAWYEAERLMEQAWFRELPAVKAGRVAVVDGSAMFNRPGPRLVDAFEWLVGWLNDRPELIPIDFPWRELGT
ncbi:MAG: ABC transporter substrate-binding protein [Planctomycetota bacterium]